MLYCRRVSILWISRHSITVALSLGGPSETMERTFVMVKPDGVERRLAGEIIRRFETRGLRLVGLKLLVPGITANVTVRGWAIPPAISEVTPQPAGTIALTANLGYINDDQAIYIAYGAAWEIAQKNSEDPVLLEKIPRWQSEWYAASVRLYNMLDPVIAKRYFQLPTAPSVVPAQEEQGQ